MGSLITLQPKGTSTSLFNSQSAPPLQPRSPSFTFNMYGMLNSLEKWFPVVPPLRPSRPSLPPHAPSHFLRQVVSWVPQRQKMTQADQRLIRSKHIFNPVIHLGFVLSEFHSFILDVDSATPPGRFTLSPVQTVKNIVSESLLPVAPGDQPLYILARQDLHQCLKRALKCASLFTSQHKHRLDASVPLGKVDGPVKIVSAMPMEWT